VDLEAAARPRRSRFNGVIKARRPFPRQPVQPALSRLDGKSPKGTPSENGPILGKRAFWQAQLRRGQNAELWCPGGEDKVHRQNMVDQSRACADQCLLFTSLVSKKEQCARALYKSLKKAKSGQPATWSKWRQGQKNKPVYRVVLYQKRPNAQPLRKAKGDRGSGPCFGSDALPARSARAKPVVSPLVSILSGVPQCLQCTASGTLAA